MYQLLGGHYLLNKYLLNTYVLPILLVISPPE